MVWFAQTPLVGGDGLVDVIGLSDLITVQVGQGTVLYATSGTSEYITAFTLGAAGSLSLLDQEDIGAPSLVGATPSLTLISLQGEMTAVLSGHTGGNSVTFDVAGSGALTLGGSVLPLAQGLQVTHSSGASFLYGMQPWAAGLTGYALAADTSVLTITPLGGVLIEDPSLILAHATAGDADILLAASVQDNALTAYVVNADGSLTEGDQIGAQQWLGVNIPTALEVAYLNGTTYAIMASAGTSSLSVMAVDATGGLSFADHIIDALFTRFQSITAIEVIHYDDRVFVMVGGADDGISLLTLLPNGTLVHLETMADETTTPLQNVTAITSAQTGDMVHFYVASEGEAGLSQFDMFLGNLGGTVIAEDNGQTLQGGWADDMLVGGAGDDVLLGAGGYDVLYDGAGSDTLSGSHGIDVFVLEADGAVDYITDFQPWVDQLDLSLWPMLYDVSQLEFSIDGITLTITHRNETLVIDTMDGWLFAPWMVATVGLFGVDRPLTVLNLPQEADPNGDTLTGGSGLDNLVGGIGDDRLEGMAGDDTLEGGAGNDQLLGSFGNDVLMGGAGADTISASDDNDMVRGGDGNDQIGGGNGFDTLYGDAGNDIIGGGNNDDYLNLGAGNDAASGGWGDDTVLGGSGNDTLAGSYDSDTVEGNDGNDNMGGGLGHDQLSGGDGNDTMGAGPGQDTLWGGDGNDFLAASEGQDLLFGENGDDILNAGTGNDLMWGGAGADTFVFSQLRPNEIDTVMDFEDGIDTLRLHGVQGGFKAVSIVQSGLNTYVSYDGHLIVLQNTDASDITAADFILV